MQTTTYKRSLVAAFGAATLATVLASCGGGSSYPNSLATGAITVSGVVEQGQTLTVTSTLSDADGLGTLTYQWQADGVDIVGATGSTLVLATAQVGKAISVVVTYIDGRGNREIVSSAVTVKAVFAASNLQGIWTAGTIGVDAASMVVLSNGATWMLVNHSPQVQLIVAALKGTANGYDGTGKQYTSGLVAAPVVVSFLTSVVERVSQTGTVTPVGAAAKNYSFSYDNRYQSPALMSDIAGNWSGSRNAGTVLVNWSVSAAGVLTGSSTAGCSYAGTIGVHGANAVPVGVFDLVLTETCINLGVTDVKNFAGIVTQDAAKTAAIFAFTTTSGSEGDAQRMTKVAP